MLTSRNQPNGSTFVRLAIMAAIILTGIAVANSLPLGFLVIALCLVVLATRIVDVLPAVLFWTLPYMIVNTPTGAFTLKLPEAVAYIFATAAATRAFIRRDRWSMPPATIPVLVFLAVMLVCTALEPSAPTPFLGAVKATDRNSPAFRSLSIIIWMGLSWLVVIAAYNIIGRRKDLFQKCAVAHCLSAGVASVVSMALFVLAVGGFHLFSNGGSKSRATVLVSGDFFRLAGVAYEPLDLAFYLITTIPITLIIYLLYPSWASRKLMLISLAFQCVALCLTFSAGGLAGMVVVIISLVVFLRHTRVDKNRMRTLVRSASVFLTILVIAAIAVSGIISMVGRTLNKITNASKSNRAGEWTVGEEEFKHYPLLGVGPGMSNYHFPQYDPDMSSQQTEGVSEVNDIVLGVLGETGVVGFVTLCYVVLAGMRPLAIAVKRYGPERVPILLALSASLVGCAIQSLSMNFGVFYLIYFTGLLSLTVSAYRAEPTISRPEVA
jgi:hypothetical protein